MSYLKEPLKVEHKSVAVNRISLKLRLRLLISGMPHSQDKTSPKAQSIVKSESRGCGLSSMDFGFSVCTDPRNAAKEVVEEAKKEPVHVKLRPVHRSGRGTGGW